MGLLERAKRVLGAGPATSSSRAQPYRVACPDGHVLHGHRTDGYQALRCPECNQGIFVLPRSPLPEPVAPRSKANSKPAGPARRRPSPTMTDDLVLSDPPSPAEIRRARDEHAATRPRPAAPEPGPGPPEEGHEPEPEAVIEWIDAGDEPAASVELPEPATAPRPRPRSRPRPRPEAPPEPDPRTVPPGMVAVEDRPNLGEWAARHKNGLIFAAVALIAVMTVAFKLRQRRIETLPQVVEIGRVQGLTKLDEGDFPAAKQILADAARAVEGLGGQVEGAEAILQGAREAALFADFKGESLGALVEEAAKFNPPDAWPAQFDALYRGRSLILMGEVLAPPDPARPGSGYVIDQPIFYGNGPIPAGRGRLDLAGFRLLERARPNVKDVVTFGARLGSIRFDPVASEWVVTLEPDSGAFITHAQALAHLPGWDRDGEAADPEARP